MKDFTFKDILTISNEEQAKILRTKSEKVEIPLSKENESLLNAMCKYVRTCDGAIGLSAVQVGELKRMCIVQTRDGKYLKLVNPKIIGHGTKQTLENEGCLSVLDFEDGLVPRWVTIKVLAYDATLKKTTIVEYSGINAEIIQHEIDHMDGILFIDKVIKSK